MYFLKVKKTKFLFLPDGKCRRAGRWSSKGPADPFFCYTPTLPGDHRVDTATAGSVALPTLPFLLVQPRLLLLYLQAKDGVGSVQQLKK